MSQEKLMDTEEVAEYLNIHYKTVMNLIERGELHGLKIGRVWRFRKADVDEYIRKQLEQSRQQPPPE